MHLMEWDTEQTSETVILLTINATMNVVQLCLAAAEIRISVNALLCEVLQKIVCSYHSMICIMGVRTHLSWSADLLLTPYKSTGKLFS